MISPDPSKPLEQRRDLLAPLRRILAGGAWVVLDTETTGLSARDEIVEVAILDPVTGLFESLVRPAGPISADAARLHGLGPAELEAAPRFAEVAPKVRRLLGGRTVLGYNVAFDRRILWRELERAGQPAPRCRWYCLCELVTRHCGSRLSLAQALERYGEPPAEKRHRAGADVHTLLRLARALDRTRAAIPED